MWLLSNLLNCLIFFFLFVFKKCLTNRWNLWPMPLNAVKLIFLMPNRKNPNSPPSFLHHQLNNSCSGTRGTRKGTRRRHQTMKVTLRARAGGQRRRRADRHKGVTRSWRLRSQRSPPTFPVEERKIFTPTLSQMMAAPTPRQPHHIPAEETVESPDHRTAAPPLAADRADRIQLERFWKMQQFRLSWLHRCTAGPQVSARYSHHQPKKSLWLQPLCSLCHPHVGLSTVGPAVGATCPDPTPVIPHLSPETVEGTSRQNTAKRWWWSKDSPHALVWGWWGFDALSGSLFLTAV